MKQNNIGRHMSRLQSIADYGANRKAFVKGFVEKSQALKEVKEDPPLFWSSVHRLSREAPQYKPDSINPDAVFFLAYMHIRGAVYDEPDMNEILDQHKPQRKALWEKYGWPKLDDEGDDWCPYQNLPEGEVPEDVEAHDREVGDLLEAAEKAVERRLFERYGVGDILDLQERDPEEFDRRLEAGRKEVGWDRLGKDDDEQAEGPKEGITE